MVLNETQEILFCVGNIINKSQTSTIFKDVRWHEWKNYNLANLCYEHTCIPYDTSIIWE